MKRRHFLTGLAGGALAAESRSGADLVRVRRSHRQHRPPGSDGSCRFRRKDHRNEGLRRLPDHDPTGRMCSSNWRRTKAWLDGAKARWKAKRRP